MNAQLVPAGGDGGVKAPSNFVECKLEKFINKK